MKTLAQTASQALTSVAVSVAASTLASWLLRRLIFRADEGGEKPEGDGNPVVVVVMPLIVGNTIGSQLWIRRQRPAERLIHMLKQR